MAECYPGARTLPLDVYALAEEYWAAAHALKERGRRGEPLSWAPFRLCAIHAIELYLNALLLRQGKTSEEIRGLQHNLASRVDLAVEHGLNLRQRTTKHIRKLDLNREYLATRYGPELLESASLIPELIATLEELHRKVPQMLGVDPRNMMTSAR